ncbi:DUF3404 domain-containing protein [Thaumasiovibrio subtropicus]|uniref:ATP-binding protein n=1 Tax=Thaumasiovibrio subtropicus TaxID=1891207 RepID=UPI000B3557DA|nr:DUF3404 domain-containing protein [Thaumasiovibrio subtropicus]
MKLIVLLISLFSAQALALTVPERLSLLKDDFAVEHNIAEVDFRQFQLNYPEVLLLPEYQLPQTAQYPVDQLQRLYRNAQLCKGPWPVNPLLTQPVVFTRAVCNKTVLPVGWFARADYIHPGGGSYARRYVALFPERYDELIAFYHISERAVAEENSELFRLQHMSESALRALIAGADFLIAGEELWVRHQDVYRVYDRAIWSRTLDRHDISFNLVSDVQYCVTHTGNICWQSIEQSKLPYYLAIGLVVFNLLFVMGWGFHRWKSHQKILAERMLVLQILTHELRTPIASLGLTVEGFRRQFDSLPENVYDEFRRLCEDSRRLKQLAEASKDYLQSTQGQLSVEHVPSFNEWVEFVCEPFDVTLSLPDDQAVDINVYWLATCVSNLLANGQKYGVAPLTLSASISRGRLVMRICDQGPLTAKDWARIRKPFVSERGLGLGLTIVESMIKRMGGKLSLEGPPTTFVVEIPCESNTSASRR